MSLPNQIHPFHVVGTGSQYNIARSLRFRKSNSAYLSRTPSGAGNRQTWTWSGWVKLGSILSTDYPTLFMGGATQSDTGALRIGFGTNNLMVQGYNTNFIVSSQVFRDFSAWYHILIAFDTTQATATNRLKAYVNGTQITAFGTDNRSSLTQNTNYGINQAALHTIGYESVSFGSTYSDFYLGEYYFIDGQALTPSSFGTTDSVTGAWIPTRYTGTYGTNGFYLPFSDNSSIYSTPRSLGTNTTGSGGGSGISLTTTAAVNAGETIIVAISAESTTFRTVSTVTDTAGNSYTRAKQQTDGGSVDDMEVWYCANALALSSGSTITATYSGSITGGSPANQILAAAIPGLGSTTVDITQSGYNASATTISLSSGTLAQAQETLIGFSMNEGSAATLPSGWTNINSASQSGNYTNLAYKYVNSTSSVTYNPTWTSSKCWSILISLKGISAGLGVDNSSNYNNWTPSGISVTAGTTNDSLVDSPTNYGSDTGAGGEVRGNYCTLSPIYYGNTYCSLTEGNLKASGTSANYGRARCTWMLGGTEHQYAEFTVVAAGDVKVGIANISSTDTSYVGSDINSWCYDQAGRKGNNGSFSAYGTSFTTNDVIGVEYNNGTLTFYKNGVSQGSAFTGLDTTTLYTFAVSVNNTSSVAVANFGQNPWQKWNGSAYVTNTAPSGTKALCTQNLPTPSIGLY